jgi:thiamine-phosphate pyrophosphorylase
VEKIKVLIKDINIPCFAIGGIYKSNISSLKNHGINKVAIVSGLLNSEDSKEEAIATLLIP